MRCFLGKVYYVGYYDTIDSKQEREYYLSATNFMDYISKKLSKIRGDVELVSMSPTKGKKVVFGKKKSIGDRVRLKCFTSLGRLNSFFARLDMHLLRLQLFLYLFFHVRKDDTVVVYHSMNYARTLIKLRKCKKFKFILQVAEIYQDVGNCFSEKQKQEEYTLFQLPDGYIFSNDYLNKKLNIRRCPYSIIYGIYNAKSTFSNKFEDGKIHCVYAGTLDPRKGGAQAAAAAEFLDGNYHVHILGDGSKEDKEYLLNEIERVNKVSQSTVSYDGLMKGAEFDDFLSKCHIGLSTQKSEAAFNETSFPSKVLTYLCNGLQVVTVRLKALEGSKVAPLLNFYNQDTPQEIARCIKKLTDLNKDNKAAIDKLDCECEQELEKLIQQVEVR